MPVRVRSKCPYPRCLNLRPCPTHKPTSDTKTPEEQRFYGSYQWKQLRSLHARREPLCRECNKQGITVLGTLSDHIVAIRDGGEPLDMNNLQRLCERHHNAKRQQERHRGRVKSLQV